MNKIIEEIRSLYLEEYQGNLDADLEHAWKYHGTQQQEKLVKEQFKKKRRRFNYLLNKLKQQTTQENSSFRLDK
jgi:hypothetical protein